MAFIVASACVFNNYIDRGIDSKMSRTEKRALVTGQISKAAALTYGTILGLLGLALAAGQINGTFLSLTIAAWLLYVVIYGIAKRRTVYSTIIGSIPGAVPPAAGYAALTGSIDKPAVLLFLSIALWQMPHFYAIAMYRYKEYEAAGLPVLTVSRGISTAKPQILFYIAAFTVIASLLTVYGYTGFIYLIGVLIMGLLWFIKGISSYKQADPVYWGKVMFRYSLIVTMAFSILVAIGALLP